MRAHAMRSLAEHIKYQAPTIDNETEGEKERRTESEHYRRRCNRCTTLTVPGCVRESRRKGVASRTAEREHGKRCV